MHNILVTGSKGQLGSEIKELATSNNFFFTDRNTLDITNEENLKNYVEINKINIIINCAAYTAVDKAEEEKEVANEINHVAVKYLSNIAKEKNIKLIHISTDYVFDGKNFQPYKEIDSGNPQGVYGSTKLDGEKIMLKINPKNSKRY